jgi:hypothetical protein
MQFAFSSFPLPVAAARHEDAVIRNVCTVWKENVERDG